jgi:hypothetical protein
LGVGIVPEAGTTGKPVYRACPQSRRAVPPARARGRVARRRSPSTLSTISAPTPGTAPRSIAASCPSLRSNHIRGGSRSSCARQEIGGLDPTTSLHPPTAEPVLLEHRSLGRRSTHNAPADLQHGGEQVIDARPYLKQVQHAEVVLDEPGLESLASRRNAIVIATQAIVCRSAF